MFTFDTPKVQQLIQKNYLTRAVQDKLFPLQLFRDEVASRTWNAAVGETITETSPGLMQVNMAPIPVLDDPMTGNFSYEQWSASVSRYGTRTMISLDTSKATVEDLVFGAHQRLSENAAQTLNRLVRNVRYNAAMSGNTVADGAQTGVTSLRVKRLNGLTTARNPNSSGAGASPIRFSAVSVANPLSVRVFSSGSEVTRNITGFIPDNANDVTGPGVIVLDAAVTVLDRAYVVAADATTIVRPGGGLKVDDVGAGDLPTIADVLTVTTTMRMNSVPGYADGNLRAFCDPVSEARMFSDADFKELLIREPGQESYKKASVGTIMGTTFIRNNECPSTLNVQLSSGAYTVNDGFGGELTANGQVGGLGIRRILFSGAGGVQEYTMKTREDLNKIASFMSPSGNQIGTSADGVDIILLAPTNVHQDKVETAWKFIGGWVERTDAATGDAQRYKREMVIEHA